MRPNCDKILSSPSVTRHMRESNYEHVESEENINNNLL